MKQERLAEPFGLLVDKKSIVEFRFEGRDYEGYAGDTIASALTANGQQMLSRSFKFHRPRGVLSMAGQDSNSLVQLPSDPNVLADRELISAGLDVTAQNVSGSLQNDRRAFIGRLSHFLPVGFYYKAFFKPRGMWEKWAPLIRRAAGLGVIDQKFERTNYDKQYKFCDVAVIGGGPAGMAAAIEAANDGAEVLLIDENPMLGGSLNYTRFDVEGDTGRIQVAKLTNEIDRRPNITVITNATCNGWFADHWLPVIQGARMFKVRARRTILCTGSLEQPAIFRNNDLPGIMLGSAAQRLMRLYGVRPGQTACVLAGNNDAYGLALDLLDAGITVAAIIEMREQPRYDEIAAAAISRGISVKTGSAVYAAHKNKAGSLQSIGIRKIDSQGICIGEQSSIPCDLLCMSVGFMPTYQLVCQAGGTLSYDDNSAAFELSGLPKDLDIAGSVNGRWQLDSVLEDGRTAGARSTADDNTVASNTINSTTNIDGPNFGWPIFPHPEGKEFVDFDEDLQIADIINATRDGYEHLELVKRYSTCGMGPSQGRHSALATARLVARATGKIVAETGVTTARPPFAPERLAHVAGRTRYPIRYTNIHRRHLEMGAQMMQAAAWVRPAYYGHADKKQDCINAEVINVRRNVGLIDVSTLGGLEIRGKDAAEFLNRIYTFQFATQKCGTSRYALMTNEAGVIVDDGVACRLSESHYYVSATTGGVDHVFRTLLKWKAQWHLQVDIANVSSAWSAMNVAGPQSRAVLKTLTSDIDFDAAAFPYLGVREGTLAGITARVIRVGFVGELGYEIHIPHQCGEALWDAILHAGSAYGIRPFGVEAQRILRLEKGHIIVAQDTDAMSNPLEIQMGWAIARKKPYFVGARTITELQKSGMTRVLAGFEILDLGKPIPKESHLVLDGERMVGRVTSCGYSPSLDKIIGLAYVPSDNATGGSRIMIKSDGGTLLAANIVSLPFYDPGNLRQEAKA